MLMAFAVSVPNLGGPNSLMTLINNIRSIYGDGPVPLHRLVFAGDEKSRLLECIDSNFVSSAGELIGEFERQVAAFTGARHAEVSMALAADKFVVGNVEVGQCVEGAPAPVWLASGC